MSNLKFGLEIRLNEEKIKAEKVYSVEKIEKFFNEIFSSKGMCKNDDGIYINGSFEVCGGFILSMLKRDWFKRYVHKFFLYEFEDGNIIYKEDLLKEKEAYAEKIVYL